MAQFRTVADIVDSVLLRSGEVTNGNSAFEARALEYVNRIHRSILIGGHELNITVDEVWPWARAQNPILLELQPKYNSAAINLTNGSEVGAFTVAPSISLQGYHLRVDGRSGVFKIAEHTASQTAFELDGAYDNDTGTSMTYRAFKLDYDLVPTYLIVNTANNKLDFEETAGVELTATIPSGSYTPAELVVVMKTQLENVAASVYTPTYSAITRKFTIVSDLSGGGNTFKLLGATGSNAAISMWELIGFDAEDIASATSHSSVYVLGGIARLAEPIIYHRRHIGNQDIQGLDPNRFQKEYPIYDAAELLPTRFTVLSESNDGKMQIRFNNYPDEEARIEIPYVPIPRDLKDNAASFPLIPRKDIDVLELGAAAEILEEKSDSKADKNFQRAGAKLLSMVNRNRGDAMRRGKFFGQTIPRRDKLLRSRRRLIFGVPEEP